MEDPLAALPKLKGEELTPCVCCQKQLLSTGFPLFYRAPLQRVGIDANAIRERIGLISMWGGDPRTAPLAEIFAARDPGIVMDQSPAVNVCIDCAQVHTFETIYFRALEACEGRAA